jgi:hypothetical protein
MSEEGSEQANAREASVLAPQRHPADEYATALQRLDALLDQVEEFVTGQFRRLEMAVRLLEAPSGANGSPPEAQVAKWRRLWDDEHAAERQRLQEEGQLLRRAWKEIEDEQRRLLGLRESLKPDRVLPSEAVNREPPEVAEATEVEQMALSQFQELRRQIQSHARCRKST